MLRASEGLGVGAGGVRRGRRGHGRQGLQQIQTGLFRTKGAWQGDAAVLLEKEVQKYSHFLFLPLN